MRIQRRSKIAATVLAAALLAAACGSDDETSSTTDAPASTAAPTTAAPAATEAPADTEPAATAESPAATEAPPGTEAPQETAAPATDSVPPESTGSGSEEDLEALYEAAQEEGSVLWYSTRAEVDNADMEAAFEAKYPGVDVEILRLSSAPLAERFSAEKESGAPTADLLYSSDPLFMRDSLANGWSVTLEEAGVPGLDAVPEEHRYDELGTAQPVLGANVFLYNSDLVSEDEVPKTWDELVDERWAGEVITADPSTTNTSLARWGALIEHFGEEFIGEFGQMVRYIDGGATSVELLAAGEASIMAPTVASIAEELVLAGAPIKAVLPDVTVALFGGPMVVSESEHPNAARLLASFMLSEEGADVWHDPSIYSFSVYRPDEMPTILPTNIAHFDEGDRIRAVLGLG